MDLSNLINGIKKVTASIVNPIQDAGGNVSGISDWANSPTNSIEWNPSWQQNSWSANDSTLAQQQAGNAGINSQEQLYQQLAKQSQQNAASIPKQQEAAAEKEPEAQKASGLNPVTNYFMDLDAKENGVVPTDETNKIYEDLYAGQGYDRNADQNNWFDHLAKFIGGANLEAAGEDVRPEDKETFDDWWEPYVAQSQDDGTMNTNNLTSNFMTGKQYRQYVEAGIPGLSPDKIKDDQVYSKRDEQLNNGFVPYVPDDATYAKLAVQNAASKPSEFWNGVRNARANNTVYDITMDGKQFSSKDFDRDKASEWFTDVNDGFNDAPTYRLNGFDDIVFDPVNNPLQIDGEGFYVTSENDDGTASIYFDDGSRWTFDGTGYQDDENGTAAHNEMVATINAIGNDDSMWIPSYEDQEYDLGNGDKLSYSQVKRLLQDTTASDDVGGGGFKSDEGISYDFGPLNWNKPAEAMDHGILTDDNGINIDELAPQLADIALSSAQYFGPKPLAILSGLSDSYMASKKMDPMSQGKNGELKSQGELTDENKAAIEAAGYDVDEYEKARQDAIAEKALGNALMPFMEYGLGGIGKNPLNSWVGKQLSRIPGAKTAADIVGEGVEEIPGNITEEWSQNGSDRFAWEDYLRDADGNIQMDSNGNPLMQMGADGSTLLIGPDGKIDPDRWDSFWGDAPEAFMGGATLGAAFKGLESLPKIPGAVSKARHKKNVEPEYYDPIYEWDYRKTGEN